HERCPMANVVCLGELLIDLVPTVSGTSPIEAPAFRKAPGGTAAKRAPGLARPGAGRRIAADSGLRFAFWASAAARVGLRLAIGSARIVALSDDVLPLPTGTGGSRAARPEPRHEVLELMVMTRGPAGCVHLTRVPASAVAGFRVEAVDTTCRRRPLRGRS